VPFLLPAVLYLALGAVLAFGYHTIIGDAWSRVGNANYVLFSRDAHLGAIGFVWTPLPSLLVMPLLPFQAIFPGLVQEGYAANIVSALAMAAAVYQMYGFASDLGIRASLRYLLTAIFALHPMIVLYGANGMSEALFLLFLLTTVRFVARWLKEPNVLFLVVAAASLALAYLTRYEAVIAAAAAASVVGPASYLREPGPRERRRLRAAADLLVLLVPIGAAFFFWALASWIITGDPFPIFNSVYGNSAYVERAATQNAAATGQGTAAALGYVVAQIVGLQPLLPVMLAAGALAAWWRRDVRILAIVVVLAGVLAFQFYAFISGRTYGWLRFYITAVPLGVMVAALCVAEDRGHRLSQVRGATVMHRITRHVGRSRWPRVVAGGVLAGALVFAAIPSIWAMGNLTLGRGETAEQVNALLERSGEGIYEQYSAEQYRGTKDIAQTIDEMQLPRGAVLVDNATAFPIVLQSRDPRTYVITSDRDFEAALADPKAFGVQYLLLPPDFQGHDALNRAYPSLYFEGAPFAELVTTFDSPGRSPDWRLYRVIGNTP
jgi:hypothetical protein